MLTFLPAVSGSSVSSSPPSGLNRSGNSIWVRSMGEICGTDMVWCDMCLVATAGRPSLNNLNRLPPMTVAPPNIGTKSDSAINVTETNWSFVSLIPIKS